jgi:hypothetical protein
MSAGPPVTSTSGRRAFGQCRPSYSTTKAVNIGNHNAGAMSLMVLSKVDHRVAIPQTLTSPRIGEGFRDDLVFVFVHDVTGTLFAEHRDVVSVSLEHDPQLLHT